EDIVEHREFYSLPPTLLELNNLISLFFTLVSFIFGRVQILIFSRFFSIAQIATSNDRNGLLRKNGCVNSLL
ncbi:MAG: hypothetical protein IKL31_04660, partial [Ruminococcus sp.]|nr:hypothetical protein [Ruminococcus sp.]